MSKVIYHKNFKENFHIDNFLKLEINLQRKEEEKKKTQKKKNTLKYDYY